MTLYQGLFVSDNFPYVKGKITIDASTSEPSPAVCRVTLSYQGAYRINQKISFEICRNRIDKYSTSMTTYTGYFDKQTFFFSTEKFDEKKLVFYGSYSSIMPFDKGHFTVERVQ